MSRAFQNRVKRLEVLRHGDPDTLKGAIEIQPGQTPLDALADAAPGLWLLIGPGESWGCMGRVTAAGKRTVHFGGNDEPQIQ